MPDIVLHTINRAMEDIIQSLLSWLMGEGSVYRAKDRGKKRSGGNRHATKKDRT